MKSTEVDECFQQLQQLFCSRENQLISRFNQQNDESTSNKKNVYIEIWYEQILLTGKQDTRNAEIKQKELIHMQELPLTTPTTMYMCVLQHLCA